MEKNKRKYEKTDTFGYSGFNFMKIVGAWMMSQEIKLVTSHDFTVKVLGLSRKRGDTHDTFHFEGKAMFSIPEYVGSVSVRKVTESFVAEYCIGTGMGKISYKIPYSPKRKPKRTKKASK